MALQKDGKTNAIKRNSKIIFTDGITWFFIEKCDLKKRYDLGAIQRHQIFLLGWSMK